MELLCSVIIVIIPCYLCALMKPVKLKHCLMWLAVLWPVMLCDTEGCSVVRLVTGHLLCSVYSDLQLLLEDCDAFDVVLLSGRAAVPCVGPILTVAESGLGGCVLHCLGSVFCCCSFLSSEEHLVVLCGIRIIIPWYIPFGDTFYWWLLLEVTIVVLTVRWVLFGIFSDRACSLLLFCCYHLVTHCWWRYLTLLSGDCLLYFCPFT